jgi:hypothetical protein
MSQALFEVAFDPITRLPLLPTQADGSYTLFDGSPGQGWCLGYDVPGTPPTVTVRVATSSALLESLKADPSLLWLADVGSPVKDATVNAAQAQTVRDWLRDHGYSGAAFGLAMSSVNGARSRRAVVALVLQLLHDVKIEDIERISIGGGE